VLVGMPMRKVILVLILMLGLAWNCRAQTWSYVQDSVVTYCNGGASSCSAGVGTLAPTTAGTIWIVRIHTPNNVTISSVSGGGATWSLCPSSSCHLFNSANGDNQDLAYGIGGSAGTTNITVNLSGNAGSFFGMNFIEILPPAGSTPSFDAAGTVTTTSCTTCTAVGLTLTATDAVIQVMSGNNAASVNSWSPPYITDIANDGVALNINSGVAPTVTVPSSGVDFSAIAFKSSLGTFTAPVGPISQVNFAASAGMACNPTCSLSIPPPAIGSGHLLYLQAANLSGPYIQSVSGGGTWVVPTGCQVKVSGTSDALSCAYVLSSTSAASSISITMTGNSTTGFTFSEVATSSGSFLLDAIGATQNSASYNPSGQSLTLNGNNYDVVFQSSFVPGGSSGVSWYPLTFGWYFFTNEAQQVELLNVKAASAPVAVWANQQDNATAVSGVAFKTGTGTAIAPPTGLAAVVN
jgi:hypothetical protein